MARVEGVESKVTFHGFVTEDEKGELLRSSSLFLYPSESEGGWSLSVLEAMALGVPAVVSRACEEMIREGRGFAAAPCPPGYGRSYCELLASPRGANRGEHKVP